MDTPEIQGELDAQQTLTEAVREGGRQAASGQMTAAQVQQVVLLHLSNSGVSTSNVIALVNWPTIFLLFEFFVISAQLRLSGFYDQVASAISARIGPQDDRECSQEEGGGQSLYRDIDG